MLFRQHHGFDSNLDLFNIENMEEKYKLAPGIKELIESSERAENKIPRPPNAFMLYNKNTVTRDYSRKKN